MLVKGDTPVCSGNTDTTTTDRITSTTISDAFSKSTVLTAAKTDLPMVVECEDDLTESSTSEGGALGKSMEIIDEPIVASTLVLATVSEEQEIIR